MAIKNLPMRHITLAALFLLLLAPFLDSQTDEGTGYFMDPSGNETRFIQRLSWVGDEYALRYEVIIEREAEGGYRELLRQFTPEQFIEVSLMHGKYRFCVIPYDFLNQSGTRADWMYIEVLAAMNPVLDGNPLRFVFSDDDTVYEIDIPGRNLAPGAEIYLRSSSGEQIFPFAVNTNEDGSGVRLSFYKNQLLPGNYELFIKNPGGLETSRGNIIIETMESGFPGFGSELAARAPIYYDLFLGAAWMPLVPIYDNGYRFNNTLIGAGGRLGMVSRKQGFVRFGVELTGSWSVFNNSFYEPTTDGQITDGQTTYELTARVHYVDVGINLLVQKWFLNDRLAAIFRFGAGYSQLSREGTAAEGNYSFHPNFGFSVMGFIWKNMYLEGGIDYAHWFTSPASGTIRPWLGLGWKF
jgi:hypothetical protein